MTVQTINRPLQDADRLAEIRAICEAAGMRVSVNLDERIAHGKDDTYHAPEPPDMIVFARNTDDVIAVAKACHGHDMPFMAWGAGTSGEGWVMARRGGVTIDLSAMNRIIEVNPDDFQCTVEAGVVRGTLNEYLRDTGMFFAVDACTEATIGGMASTRASGTNTVRYGTMRETVISMQVVLADGRVLRTGSFARKSAAGYDLTRLFTGAGGTLGIITELTVRLHPIPEHGVAATCAFPTVTEAAQAVSDLMHYGYPIGKVEIADAEMIRMINTYSKMDLPEAPHLFFDFSGSKATVEEGVVLAREVCAANGGISFLDSADPDDRSKLWHARHMAGWAALASRPGCTMWPTDITVPVSKLAQAIEAAQERHKALPFPAPIVGHVGDGNFHVCYIVDQNSEEELRLVRDANDRMVEEAIALGGTCTGEHGVGFGKNRWMESEFGEVGMQVMRSIKEALDPKGLLNPGKIFDL